MATEEGSPEVPAAKAYKPDQELRALYDSRQRRVQPLAMNPKGRDIPYSIRMLQDLGPGETLVYYKGNFTLDVIDCGPLYRKLLTEIRDFAQHLEYRGRIRLSQESKRMAGPNGMTTINIYTAQGVS